jgi:hypothetical protein
MGEILVVEPGENKRQDIIMTSYCWGRIQGGGSGNHLGRIIPEVSRIVPLGHVFGTLLFSSTASSHDTQSHTARKPQKHHINR